MSKPQLWILIQEMLKPVSIAHTVPNVCGWAAHSRVQVHSLLSSLMLGYDDQASIVTPSLTAPLNLFR